MIADIIAHTSKRARSTSWLCLKLICSEKELATCVKKAQKDGYNVRIRDGHVMSRTAIGPGETVTFGSTKPGRHRVGQLTDWHAGSKHCDRKAFLRTATAMWDAGVRVIAATGDILDGIGPKLIMDQDFVGFDGQVDFAVAMAEEAPPFEWAAIDGNHDGYHTNAIGMVSGRILEQRMRDAGVKWTFLGVCLGNAVIHGARWQLWHPHGGASTSNALRRILNARAESEYRAGENCPHVIAMGHFHKHVPLLVSPEPIFGVSGGTFQRKGSEFANRISGGWHIGGPIISYNRYADGNVGEFSAEFVNADKVPEMPRTKKVAA